MPGSVQSVERAAGILRLLAAHDGQQLGALSGALGLSKSTVHGLLRTLIEVGFVEQNPANGDYRLADGNVLTTGPKSMDINEMRARATNWVDALAARTGLSARLVVLPEPFRSDTIVGTTAHHVFSASHAAQRLEIGAPVNPAATAEGKVLLAFSPAGGAALDRLRPEPATARTLTRKELLRKEIDAVRARGHAIDNGESTVDGAGVAVPVRSHGGVVVAALGVRGTGRQVLAGGVAARADLFRALSDAARGTSHALMAERW
jgi:DNA-binding IclR family transcriptional regulator